MAPQDGGSAPLLSASPYALSPRRRAVRRATDQGLDALSKAAGTYRRLDRLAASTPVRDVLVMGVYERGSNAPEAVAELRRSRHRVHFAYGSRDPDAHPTLREETICVGMDGLLFDNLNRLYAEVAGRELRPRWSIVVGSDTLFTDRWLDRFVALSEAFALQIAGPANTRRSLASYAITRRSPWWLVRETGFVEVGPVFAFRDDVAAELLPFPEELGQGWGLDLHWPHLAAERGWRMGIVDATPVRHDEGPGRSYDADREAHRGNRWLESHPHVPLEQAVRVVARHRRIPERLPG